MEARLCVNNLFRVVTWQTIRQRPNHYTTTLHAIAEWLVCSRDPGSGLAGRRWSRSNRGQLLFAPWAWAYSTLHP